ncbi:MAG: aspartate-semialdehyde dehydrogenase [Clostridia bacterium]|nr:aspartate-semialdehyde dehydrogenase [Clostridia bacterium]
MTNVFSTINQSIPDNLSVGIVGVSGLVGKTLLSLLEKYEFPVSRLSLFGSSYSENKTVKYLGRKLRIQNLLKALDSSLLSSSNAPDCVFMCANSETSKELTPRLNALGTMVIDNSSYYRLQPDIPLIIPEINGFLLQNEFNIIANPNCVTAIYLTAIYPIIKLFGAKKLVLTSLQSVSGAGQKALDNFLSGESQLVNNNYPQIDEMCDDGYTLEEKKIVGESLKILKSARIDCKLSEIYATCVRTPVTNCHSVSIYLETAREVDPIRLHKGFEEYPYAVCTSEISPLLNRNCVNDFRVFLGRVRVDGKRVICYVSGDNLLRGAALNALGIFWNYAARKNDTRASRK